MTEEAIQPTNMDSNEELLSFDEAIKFLDTSKSTLYRLLSQEDVRGVKVGKQWRFRMADLKTYLERSPVANTVDASAMVDLDAELTFFEAECIAAGQELQDDDGSPEKLGVEHKIATLINRVISIAITSSASDIHLEPTVTTLRLRYRIDGVLNEIRRMPMSLHESLIARLKEMAEMNLSEKRLPQDGRIPVNLKNRAYDLRMSVLPTIHGENAVIRILDRGNVLIGLDRLGSNPAEMACLRPWIQRSAGMIIVTGPTGSGKTTLMYSCLQEIDREQKKVLSVEDPVEFEIADVAQTQVNKRIGMTFAAAMRSYLRQDPDVIMCGEVRDQETAELAAEAAITGHLVLIPLHTEDAPSALTRLSDIGVERHLIVSMVNGIVATRLARKLCAHCKAPAEGDEAIAMVDRVSRLASMGGYKIPAGAVFYTAVGCDKCRNTGYRGRLGLFEILPCTPILVSKLFQCDTNEDMKYLAVQSGMRTLVADGIRKAVAGETSIDEVLRATGTWI